MQHLNFGLGSGVKRRKGRGNRTYAEREVILGPEPRFKTKGRREWGCCLLKTPHLALWTEKSKNAAGFAGWEGVEPY